MSSSRSIKEVCETHGVDGFWFIHNFRRRYSMNPAEYVVREKHIRAAALLLDGEHSVRDVMAETGYSSRSQFSATFKRFHGYTPAEYASRFDGMIGSYPDEPGKDDTG